MEVADPTAFVENPESEGAMQIAVADVANVHVDTVSVDLSAVPMTRRLLAARRLQQLVVAVEANITVADESAATALQTTIAAVSPEAMSNATNDALTEVGLDDLFNVTVTALASEVVLPPSPAPPIPAGVANCASVRWKGYYSLAPFVVVSAWFLSQA